MAKQEVQDATCYCERCGISFLWTVEEQRQRGEDTNGPEPTPAFCPGCRHLLAPVGHERGLVKWFNLRKSYGFIVRRQQPEVFVHGSAVQGRSQLHADDLVEFKVKVGDKGTFADAVAVVEKAAELQLTLPQARRMA